MQNTNKFYLFLNLFLVTTLLWAIFLCRGTLGADSDDSLNKQWPQWRGPNGSGTSSEQNLPEFWNSNSHNIKWKTKIPGQGNSSPIVSNGRLILTTAYESSKLVISQRVVSMAGLGLAVAFFTGAAVNWFRKFRDRTQKKIPPREYLLVERVNCLFTAITSICFVSLALVACIKPQYFDLLCEKFDFLVLPRREYYYNLLSMDKGTPGTLWLTSGGVALLGLAVSVGFIRAKSIWRLLGAAVIFLSTYLFVKFTVLDQWKFEIELWKKMIYALPALLVASWHMLNYLKIRLNKTILLRTKLSFTPRGVLLAPWWYIWKKVEIHFRHKNLWRFGNKSALFFIVLPLGLSALVFIPPNFTQSQMGTERAAVCLDAKTGNILWKQSVFTAPPERKHSENSYATPTPAADGLHIIVNFGLGIACLDFEGHILWSIPDDEYIKNSRYGAVSSPLIVNDMAIVVQECEWDSKRSTWIAAFEKRTGRRRWKIKPANIYGCYTTPLLYQDGAKTQLIISSWEILASFDIESGQLLWSQKIPTQQLVASMARSEDFLCLGGGTYGPKATFMMRLNGKGKDTKADVLWQSDSGAPGNSSPIIYDGKLFVVTDTGIMTCYDVPSGKVLWNHRLKGRHLSSLVAGDGRIYACNTKGLTTVIAADSELKVLAENDLQELCYASPAIADGCIFIRTANHLYCIEKEGR
jgi:outer membrane protein assembly factor BamB